MSPVLESDPNASFGLKDAFSVLLAGAMGLLGLVHRGHEKRLEKLEDQMNNKADAKQAMDSFSELFRECREIRKEVADSRVEMRDSIISLERTIRASIERNSLE